MNEYFTPAVVEADPKANVTDLLMGRLAETPDSALFSLPTADGGWEDVTTRQFHDQVVALAKGMIAAGVKPGEKIGFMCKTRYEWTLVDFATWFAGAVLVPIYETSAPSQIQYILEDSGATAIILETVVGTAGVLVPPDGYLSGVRELCDRHGIVFILDEVMAGFGRTGEWFAADHWDVVPDLMTFAKGVNSGYVPLGGVAISEPIAEIFATRPYPGGLTYSGHPLACASAVATINAMREEGIVENAARIGEHVLGPGLRELAERHPSVGEVRGMGVFWAVELVRDRESRRPLVPYNATGADNAPMAEFTAACKQRGLWPFVNMNRTHVVPPCTISEDEARAGLAILDEALTVADAHCD